MCADVRWDVFYQLKEVFFKVFSKKNIKKRIQTIVKVSDTNGEGHSCIHNIGDFAICYYM